MLDRQVGQRPGSALKTFEKHSILKSIPKLTGKQCKHFKTGALCSALLVLAKCRQQMSGSTVKNLLFGGRQIR